MMNASASPEQRLKELGIELPVVRPPAGTFVHAVRAGVMLYLSGHPPFRADGSLVQGRLGESLSVDEGYEAARLSAMGILSTVRTELDSLDLVQRIVRVSGVVNATADFLQHTQVINGASDLLVEVFGARGQHARWAVGMSSLPFNMCLEVDLIALVEP